MTKDEFMLRARASNCNVIEEITPNLPEGMRHVYAETGERIAGVFNTRGGKWFNTPIRWFKSGRKFRRV